MSTTATMPVKGQEKKQETQRKNLVAVYGTLRRDFHNHRLLEFVGNDHVGDGVTENPYALMVEGLPYLFEEPAIDKITVEVYAVDDDGLSQLDRLERHPVWYCRKEIPVILQNGEKVTAWLYFQIKGEYNPGFAAVKGDYKMTKESRGW